MLGIRNILCVRMHFLVLLWEFTDNCIYSDIPLFEIGFAIKILNCWSLPPCRRSGAASFFLSELERLNSEENKEAKVPLPPSFGYKVRESLVDFLWIKMMFCYCKGWQYLPSFWRIRIENGLRGGGEVLPLLCNLWFLGLVLISEYR